MIGASSLKAAYTSAVLPFYEIAAGQHIIIRLTRYFTDFGHLVLHVDSCPRSEQHFHTGQVAVFGSHHERGLSKLKPSQRYLICIISMHMLSRTPNLRVLSVNVCAGCDHQRQSLRVPATRRDREESVHPFGNVLCARSLTLAHG
jgi:hypothetical protein